MKWKNGKVTNVILEITPRWAWDQEQRYCWKKKPRMGNFTQSVRLKPTRVWPYSQLRIQAGSNFWFWLIYRLYFMFYFRQVFCDQSDGGGKDSLPWPGLLRPCRQLWREHHPPRPLQGDQGDRFTSTMDSTVLRWKPNWSRRRRSLTYPLTWLSSRGRQ